MTQNRGLIYLLILVGIFVLFGLVLVLTTAPEPEPVQPVAVAAGAAVAPAAAAPAAARHIGPAALYPNPALTPGDILPGVTADQVCTSGYSSSVRSVNSQEKAEVFRRYGIPDVAGKYEVDHFVSLELGGSNNVTNLWPQPYSPFPGARDKDKVEDYLHSQVCWGDMTLTQAQTAIRQDWYAVYQRMAKS